MNVEEGDRQREQPRETGSAKWGKLTRAERVRLSERRHSHQMKVYELYGISEEDAERVLAEVEQDSHDLLPQHSPKA